MKNYQIKSVSRLPELEWHYSRTIPCAMFLRAVADQKYFMVNQRQKKKKINELSMRDLQITCNSEVSSLVYGNTNSHKYAKSRIMDNHLVPFDTCHTQIGH